MPRKPYQEGFREVVLTYRENSLVACTKAYSDRVTYDSPSTVLNWLILHE